MDTNTAPMNTLEFLKLLARSPLSRTQRDVLRAMLTYADLKTWKLWPSLGTLAQTMGCDRRTVQRTVRTLHELGLLTTLGATRTGTCILRIEIGMLREVVEGELPPSRPSATRTHDTGPADDSAPPGMSEKPHPPGPHDAQTNQRTTQRTYQHTTKPATRPAANTRSESAPEAELNPDPDPAPQSSSAKWAAKHRNAAAVAKILGSEELLKHPNATPERLAYIARVAPKKQNPGGFAASAIRNAYDITQPTPAERSQAKERERAERLRRFHVLPEDQKRSVWAMATQRYKDILEHNNTARYREDVIARTMKDLEQSASPVQAHA